jgi:hypothetical protein
MRSRRAKATMDQRTRVTTIAIDDNCKPPDTRLYASSDDTRCTNGAKMDGVRRTLFRLQDVAAASTILNKTPKNRFNKEPSDASFPVSLY